MIIPSISKEEILNILSKGSHNDLDPDKIIESLINCAKYNPEFLLKGIVDMVEVRIDGMIMLSLAILSANASEEFLDKDEVLIKMQSIFWNYKPSDLIQYTEYLKSKVFGRGLGSRHQKMIKLNMELWDEDEIEIFITEQPVHFINLCRIIHPKFDKKINKIVQFFMNSRKINNQKENIVLH